MLANSALRCSWVRLEAAVATRDAIGPLRLLLCPAAVARAGCSLGKMPRGPGDRGPARKIRTGRRNAWPVFDVFRRPVDHIHAEMQTHARKHFLDLVQRLAAEVRVRSISASVFWIRSPI